MYCCPLSIFCYAAILPCISHESFFQCQCEILLPLFRLHSFLKYDSLAKYNVLSALLDGDTRNNLPFCTAFNYHLLACYHFVRRVDASEGWRLCKVHNLRSCDRVLTLSPIMCYINDMQESTMHIIKLCH